MLVQCLVGDGGPALSQRWVNVFAGPGVLLGLYIWVSETEENNTEININKSFVVDTYEEVRFLCFFNAVICNLCLFLYHYVHGQMAMDYFLYPLILPQRSTPVIVYPCLFLEV